jgi:hypothetical protein
MFDRDPYEPINLGTVFIRGDSIRDRIARYHRRIRTQRHLAEIAYKPYVRRSHTFNCLLKHWAPRKVEDETPRQPTTYRSEHHPTPGVYRYRYEVNGEWVYHHYPREYPDNFQIIVLTLEGNTFSEDYHFTS